MHKIELDDRYLAIKAGPVSNSVLHRVEWSVPIST